MDTNIILIGPMRAGKTTIGKLIAERLNIQQVSLDKLRWDYYAEIGYDTKHADALFAAGDVEAVLRYWKPFEIYAVERVLTDYPEGYVIDFGAGHSVYDDEAQFARAEQALAPFPYVILLLPLPDPDESLRILHQRDLDDGESGLPEINEHFVRHSSNYRLAKQVIYTKERTPAQTCDELLAWVMPSEIRESD
jgi:shikimate kinase